MAEADGSYRREPLRSVVGMQDGVRTPRVKPHPLLPPACSELICPVKEHRAQISPSLAPLHHHAMDVQRRAGIVLWMPELRVCVLVNGDHGDHVRTVVEQVALSPIDGLRKAVSDTPPQYLFLAWRWLPLVEPFRGKPLHRFIVHRSDRVQVSRSRGLDPRCH